MNHLLETLKGNYTGQTPLWLMRQAGRYLPEYRELRAQKGGFLELAFDPKAAAEVTIQPIRRFNMDGAIIFSDILTIPHALGQGLEFTKGEGPKLPPIQTRAQIDALGYDRFDKKMEPVYEALRQTRAQLSAEGHADTTLLGFAGAPWTIATYMVEGGGSKDYSNVKAMAYGAPDDFQALINLITEATARYLIAQINAGAQAVKIFDSWAGVLDEDQFTRWAIQPVAKIVKAIKEAHPNTPIIGFPRGAGLNYPRYIRETGVDVCAFDSMIPLDWAAENLQPLCPIQGNLDPALLLAGGEALEENILKSLKTCASKPFIFNLGHGINKNTPPEHVANLVRIVKEYKP